MKSAIRLLVAIFFLVLFAGNIFSQNFYDIPDIQKIEITFTQPNWDYQMDTSMAGSEGYIIASQVIVNGTVFDSAGVKYKGNSSYNASQVKNPLHIELSYAIPGQDYQGYSDIKLNNIAKDPSMVREVLAYSILRNYMEAPLANYAMVFINNSFIGLYVNVEAINNDFTETHFYSQDRAMIKCNPETAGPGSTDKSNLRYLGSDSSLYYTSYEVKSDYGWTELLDLCNTLENNTSSVENILDIDRALWMLAFDNVTANLDSYLGGFVQNYYLLKDGTGRFNSVIWDLNECFGVFSMAGNAPPYSVSQLQNMSQVLHLNDADWPLVSKLLSVPQYRKMYIAHMKTITEEFFSTGDYFTSAQYLQAIIDSAVQADNNKFFTYAQFQSALTTNITNGPQTIPGLNVLMDARENYLNNCTDFLLGEPVISLVNTSSANPALNSTVTFTAAVSNETAVYLGYRYQLTDQFTRTEMYDDGAHNDGSAGDGVYGIDLPVSASLIQYYVYAENNDAGKFSPVRAEFEYYIIYATVPVINPGDVVINELVASNQNGATDAAGNHEDWIELYNNTSGYLSLDNLYLSDDGFNLFKWQFPDNTVIAPGAYLIVWADNDNSTNGIHSNFKLSASGESLILSYADSTVLDIVSFPSQSADISYGRYPNGTGSFTYLGPTFAAQNSHIGVEEAISVNDLVISPNPSEGIFQISCMERIGQVRIYSLTGQEVFNSVISSNNYTIDLSSIENGMYILRAGEKSWKIIKSK